MAKAILYLSVLMFIFSCEKVEKKVVQTATPQKNESRTDTVSKKKINFDDFHIFDLYSIENGDRDDIFISLSDIYHDSITVPPEIIKNQKNIPFSKRKHFELPTFYRQKLLKGTKLSENDTLYLFNYKDNLLEKFPIKNLKAVANLNLYSGEDDEISDYYYMIGFELNEKVSREESMKKTNYSLAYFGKENPFANQKLNPVKWEKSSAKEFPVKINSKLKLGKSYKYKVGQTECYLQDLMLENEINERKLVAVKNGKIVLEKTYTKGEGAEFTPLNFVESTEYTDYQWSGNLFKGKPPVVFGFVSESFGCSAITFLDNSYPDLYTDCDNRH
ncbi:hypothetical protein LUD75_13355 [Epilithonimonas sp. JDS]|uniref:hypothetical protein n=1 Tax=Epilithonimonas sp. JDS TaxID=2902797 RepID=UPI001E589AF7|nr:hypothetical protein [Epilithonimonas sp. JDS]MCD9855704.1 hypothetical protein [Epilithonimonas sp. JDS]